jgi:carbamoyl-phosphate synthase large subunit
MQLEHTYRKARVLVTGGAGVIGSELIQQLTSLGSRVLCCDLKPRPEGFGDSVDYIRGDANYLDEREILQFNPRVAFHLAATFERTVETGPFWDENFWHNARLSHHLMTLLRKVPDLGRVVFAGSYLVYDPKQYLFDEPMDSAVALREDSALRPRNACGAAKLFHEGELEFLSQLEESSFTAVTARIFRVYGRGSRDVISRWIRSLIRDEREPLRVFRKEGRFDYIYAGDVAEGLLHLGACSFEGAVNLGRGLDASIDEVLTALKRHFPLLTIKEESSQILYEAHKADMSRFETIAEWRPATTLDEGIPLVVDHEKAAKTRPRTTRPGTTSVLLSSVSAKVPLAIRFRRAMDEIGVDGRLWGADLDPLCVGRYFVDDFWRMAPLSELTPSDLKSFCREHSIRLIVPTRDGELLYFAAIRHEMESLGVSVLIAGEHAVKTCNDKVAFSRECDRAGIPAIPTFLSLEELRRSDRDSKRIVVKERYGAGSRTIGIDLSFEEARQHAQSLQAPVYQPLCSGVEHSVDLYVDRRDRIIEVIPRCREVVRHGESVISTTVEAPSLVQWSIALAKHLQLRGHNVLQAFVGGEDVQFIECNPRFGGASSLSIEAGLNSPRWSLAEALGEDVPVVLGQYRRGLRLVRYAADRFLAE